jgi:hypothetical protein
MATSAEASFAVCILTAQMGSDVEIPILVRLLAPLAAKRPPGFIRGLARSLAASIKVSISAMK